MRIISGARKGKLLHTLEGHDTRPMPDMAKGAIFNIIRSRVAKARVLDLFCGTGTLGMEALSNGADAVVFVEANPAAVSLLKRNIHSIQAEPRTAILPFTAGKAVKQFKNQEEYFDIIFADPPFVAMKYFTQPIKDDSLSMAELVAILQGRLSMDGLLVLRYESGDKFEPLPGFRPLSERNPARRYGRSTVAFMLRDDDPAAQFVFPVEEDFRGHRPKNMDKNVALRSGGGGANAADDGDDADEGGADLDEA